MDDVLVNDAPTVTIAAPGGGTIMPMGGEILVNTAVAGVQQLPAITGLVGGGFVVTWQDGSLGVGGATGDASLTAIKVQVFAAGGAPVGGEFLVNTAVAGSQDTGQVIALSNGGFVVTWRDNSRGVGGAPGDTSLTAIKAQGFAAGGAPVGDEIRVNTAVANSQFDPQITALVDGGFVVTWRDDSQGMGGASGDASFIAVKAQVFAAGGAPVGGEIRVNTAVANSQEDPAITALANGGFVVTWTDNSGGVGGASGDDSGFAIKAQVFAAGGARVSSEIRVNTAIFADQFVPQITALANGGFVVTWTDTGQGVGSGATGDTSGNSVKAQVFAAGGVPVGREILVNTAVANSQANSQITALTNGGFVVTWSDNSLGVGGAPGDASSTAVKAQVFAADGAPIGGEILVNTATANGQFGARITALASGGFVVTWNDTSAGVGGATGDPSGYAVKAQVFTADGAPLGGEMRVNTAVANDQIDPQITALENGGFVVTWTDNSRGVGGAPGDASSTAIKAQVFAAAPGRYTAIEQVALSLKGGITLADADSGGAVVTATVSVGYGVLTITPGTSGATVTSGNGTAAVAVRGTIAQLDALLRTDPTSTIAFTADTDTPPGATDLTVTVNDGGATGPGGAQTGSATATIAITAVNDAPTVTIVPPGTGAIAPVGSEILVNTAVAGFQVTPDIATLENGGFVITWRDNSQGVGGAPGDTSSDAVKAQMFAAGGAPVGGEILVNTAVASGQLGARITALVGGGFAAVWSDLSQGVGGASGDASGFAVKAQAFAAGGARIGGEILVNTAVANDQSFPMIAALANGEFVVTWTDDSRGVGGAAGDTSESAIKSQLFTASGARMSGEIRVNTAVANSQANSQITALTNGGFVMTWLDYSMGVGGTPGDASGSAVKAQIFAAGGARVGGEILVNTAVMNFQLGPAITALSNGGFVVTWEDGGLGVGGAAGDTSGTAIKAQVFAAGGATVGGEIRVNTAVANDQFDAEVTALSNGGFVVVWSDMSQGVGGASGDASGFAVKAQVFAATGVPVGGEIRVNTAVAQDQSFPEITALANGGFVVTWQDGSLGVGGATGDTSGTAVKAQMFTADGTPVGGELRVNTAVAGAQSAARTTALDDGGFVVTWTDESRGVGGTTGDTSVSAIKAQIFGPAPGRYTAIEQVALSLKGGIALADVDAAGAIVSATLSVAYGVLTITPGTSGTTVTSGNGTAAVAVSGTIAQLNALLRTDMTSAIAFTADTDTPPASTSLTVIVNDGGATGTGGAQTGSATATIAITAVNDAPTVTIAGNYTAVEQVALSLKGGITLADADSGGAVVTATVSVGYGVLNLATGTSGASVVSGNGTAGVVISGTIAQLDALLRTDAASTITFTADTDTPPGSTILTVTVNDDGATGTGGALEDSASATIAVTPVDDPPVAVADSGSTLENAVLTGNLITNDTDVDGGPKGVAAVNGVAAGVGMQITLASGALLTVRADGSYSYDPNGRFDGLNSAGGAGSSSATDSFGYTLNGGSSATVTVTVNGVGGDLNGTPGDDTILGTPSGEIVYLQQGGSDSVDAGDGSDGFYMGTALDNGDRLTGGPGDDDQVIIQGNYAALNLSAQVFTDIETLALQPGNDTRFGDASGALYSYNITLADANVAAGATLIVNANRLRVGETVTFDGSAESSGSFVFYMAAGDDRLTGGAGADQFYGRLGADTMTGGGGNDVFFYRAAAESTAASRDTITDFTLGDLIDLSFFDANTVNGAGTNDAFAFIGPAAFTAAGQLRATNTGGANWLIEGDIDGNGLADLVIAVTTTAGHAIVAGDFVL